MPKRYVNRAIYSCGVCGAKGHTRDTCSKARTAKRPAAFNASNTGYAANRRAGLCDDCGRRSKRSRCAACAKRRKRWPSRQWSYRKTRERPSRRKEIAND